MRALPLRKAQRSPEGPRHLHMCVEPACLCGRCTGVAEPLRFLLLFFSQLFVRPGVAERSHPTSVVRGGGRQENTNISLLLLLLLLLRRFSHVRLCATP